ncbi:MAG: copper chaperone PCu(A)C [Pseudomonadota bacterium]
MSLKSLLLAASLSLAPIAAIAGDAKIMIMDPYARSSTPTSKSGAIFFELMNHGPDDRLIAASTDVANKTELHTHKEDANGVMKMLHVEEGFAVPEGETVMFKRGGKHVMLLGLTGPLEDGATIPMTLTFEKAGEVRVDVIVDQNRKPKHGGHGSDHSSHDHGSHDS